MATRKPKEDKASTPVKGKVPDKEIKVKKQTQTDCQSIPK